ncbi:3D (Asp-Asp-Asp) domain-containing protein [Carnobacterium iners]|uniref:3D (Asp-Asp-Asp) domain-containing protein n=1 Tax=Carnobacterium iners TaxID=1073423 RepID=A0A1X7MRJ0_9LACT|nr:3D domain-containing protein [Carnobacterium iners]SEK73713.1 3D (Asp-Asp-Asp) domain-containing protein [Carnobacterium iners]SMH27469.1 3D (Asp-Asp-Asp) domain-containing protein [Carnobacterium iners]
MFNLKSKLFIASTTLALTGVIAVSNPIEASAAEYNASTWEARSVSEIKESIKNNEDGSSEYTIQWGDTLSSVASATETSLDSLINVNDINNANIIYTGNTISLSADHSTVTIEKEDKKVSYNVTPEKDVVEVETPKQEAPIEKPTQQTTGQTIAVQATAYSTNQPELSDTTATGINLNVNPNVIAVDPNFIPLGSTVTIPGYGTFIAGDTGSAIQGNRIDIHMTDLNRAINFGRQTLNVQVSK